MGLAFFFGKPISSQQAPDPPAISFGPGGSDYPAAAGPHLSFNVLFMRLAAAALPCMMFAYHRMGLRARGRGTVTRSARAMGLSPDRKSGLLATARVSIGWASAGLPDPSIIPADGRKDFLARADGQSCAGTFCSLETRSTASGRTAFGGGGRTGPAFKSVGHQTEGYYLFCAALRPDTGL